MPAGLVRVVRVCRYAPVRCPSPVAITEIRGKASQKSYVSYSLGIEHKSLHHSSE
jgi:hypothetical protein